MRTFILILLMTSTALAAPCDDDRKSFERAKKFGAKNFKCVDHYDGSASSSFEIDPEGYKQFHTSELERNRQRVRRAKK